MPTVEAARGWPFGSAAANRALIVAVTLLAYWPVLSAGYVWDDFGHVTRADLRSLSGLARIWFEPGATQQYYPMLHSAFWLEHWLWGDSALGYHLLNVVLHATAACLLGTVLQRLKLPGAWLAALLFAVHPVAVESVAWIAEQKNTLSTVFYLCALLAYLRFEDTRSRSHYAGATGWFVAALLTKTVAATLPAALLVIAWWRRGRLSWRGDVLPLLPWFALAFAGGATTAWFERTLIGAEGAAFSLTWGERLLLATRIPWFYMGKLLWPAGLVFIYPRWTVDTAAAWQYVFPLVTLAALAALVGWARRTRGPLAAILFFGGSLFPALGFINVFPFVYSYVADHFQYLAMIGVMALAAAGVSRVKLPSAALGLALAALATLTWQHAGTFRTAETLYQDVLRKNPAAWMAQNNLAILLFEAGRAAEALPHYETALKHRPDYAEAENNFGSALNSLNRSAEALPHLQHALRLQPNYAEAHNNLGVALMSLGRATEGMEAFHTAIRLKPDYVTAHLNLGLALARGGDVAQAMENFQRARAIAPTNAEAATNMGIALRALGRTADAVPHLQQAVELNPDYGPAHLHLAMVLRQLGRESEARTHFGKAEELGVQPPASR